MERNFKGPVAGDEYRIWKNRDKGGYPVIRVLEVYNDYSILVRDVDENGNPAPEWRQYPCGTWLNDNPRRFSDSKGWPKLKKFWKRNRRVKVRHG